MSSISNFLKEHVYPAIDAVDAGLLDHLKPGSQSGGAYELICPACNRKRGFYYAGSAYIQCNRKNECKNPTSVWDALASTGVAPKDVLHMLCKAAGVSPPERTQKDATSSSGTGSTGQPHGKTQAPAVQLSPGQAIIKVTQLLATAHPVLLKEFQLARGYSDDDMSAMRLGVYTSAAEVLAALNSLGISKNVAREKGYIGFDDKNPNHLWDVMDGRVVGYWPHSDGDVRLWGRIPTGQSTDNIKKYRFSKTLAKDIPYLFAKRHGSMPICVEGTLDAWALQLLGRWGVAIGQASINSEQAVFMASKGITEAAHLVDGDTAGYEGAIASIRACEPLGITLTVIPLGAGMDDADAIRKAGNADLLLSLIDKGMNAGMYLAHYYSGLLGSPTPDRRAMARVRSAARNLTPVSARYWEDYAKSLGVFFDEQVEAIRVLAGLLNAGMDLSEGIQLVRQKTGHLISIQKEEPADG